MLASVRKGGGHGLSDADLEPHGMLMKIGERPTMGGGGGVTVEVGGGCHMAVGLGVDVGTIVLLLGACDLEKPGLGGFFSAAHPAISELVVFVHQHICPVCWMPSVSSPATLNALVRLQVHVFDHKFAADFYGKDMNMLICGFLR